MAKDPDFESNECLSGRELAALLHVSPATISKDLSRAPDRLPPVVRVPGRKKAIWLRSTVMAWLRSHQDVVPNGSSLGDQWISKTGSEESDQNCSPIRRRRRRPATPLQF